MLRVKFISHMEKTALCLLALTVSLRSVTCVFFHDQSAVFLQPGGVPNPTCGFGFAMGYWNEQLIVGSPNSSNIGEVYRCPVAAVINNTNVTCSNVEFNVSSRNERGTRVSWELNPRQHFYLGASISTTEKYFFTCAPLVTKTLAIQKPKTDAYGSCFTYSSAGKVAVYKGPDYRFKMNKAVKEAIIQGGNGWNTLADEVNGFLITAKTSAIGDINYSKITKIISVPSSFTEKSNLLNDYFNVGYGLAAGRFFSNQTVYAFSVQEKKSMKGAILFLEPSGKVLLPLSNNITHSMVNAMFGYALAAADLTLDGLSELLVGAPAQSEDVAEVEYGALHIYLGGDLTSCHERSRMRTIYGDVEGGRFGTAVAAGDVDGDNIPEIFVSAPYEGTGVVYILSGYELNKTLISSGTFMEKRVSKMELTQRVERSELRLLGFSMQVVPDLDGNGCDELAIGAPGAASVLVFRCLQNVNVSISSGLIGGAKFVKEIDNKFTVSVCLQFSFKSNSSTIVGNISATNYIVGEGASISKANFTVDLSKMPPDGLYCENIDVQLGLPDSYPSSDISMPANQSTIYEMTTKLELKDVTDSKDFNKSWVVLSPYSKTEKRLEIVRRCDGNDCYPKLTIKSVKGPEPNYTLGSSAVETVTVLVRNDGFPAYKACVRVHVSGARVFKAEESPFSLRRNAERPVKIVLSMTHISNMDKELNVTATLYQNCDQDSNLTTDSLRVPYSLEQQKMLVHLDGNTHHLEITEKDMDDEEVVTIRDEHVYTITNNGSITWKNVRATIVIEKKSVILKVGTTEKDCGIFDGGNQFTINCNVTLKDNSTNKIIALVEMSKKEVGKFLNIGKQMNVTSSMKLNLDPTDYSIDIGIFATIKWKTDLTFGNNKFLIGLIAGILALLVLALIYYILRKNGFFKRKQKKRLAVLRESVRRRSIRLASESKQSRNTASAADADGHLDIEVMEDSAFEEIPVGKLDDVVLIKSKAEVHSQEKPKS